jgi:hypothetical protein
MAGEARLLDQSYPDADTLPSEKWALFSLVPTLHKLTCHMGTAIMTTLYHSDMLNYITKKHGLTDVKIGETKTECLESYLKKQKPIPHAAQDADNMMRQQSIYTLALNNLHRRSARCCFTTN